MKFQRNAQDAGAAGFRWHFEWTAEVLIARLWLPRAWRHPSKPVICFDRGVRYFVARCEHCGRPVSLRDSRDGPPPAPVWHDDCATDRITS